MSEEFKNLEEDIDDLSIADRAGFKNLVAILEYSKETRKLFRDLEVENKTFKDLVIEQKKVIAQLKGQISTILASTYGNGPTS